MDSGSEKYGTESGRHSGTTLTDAATRWPTASDAAFEDNPRNGIKGNHNLSLNNAAGRWLTPCANEDAAGRPGAKMQQQLKQQSETWAEAWATPHANMTTGAGTHGRADYANIQTQAAAWPTPRAEMDSGKHRGEADTLHSATKDWERGLPDPTATGAASSQDSGPRRLNPAFVEWLMGFPRGWCDFEPVGSISFALWETRFALRPPLEPSPPSPPN